MRANANGDPNCGPANANGRGGYVLVNGVVPSPMGGGVLVQNMSLEPQHHNHNHHHHHQQSTHHQHHHHQQRHHQQQQTYLGPPVSITDMVTFESNQDSEQTLGSLGLPSEMMPPWLEYVNPGEFFDLFDMGGGSVAGGGAVVE